MTFSVSVAAPHELLAALRLLFPDAAERAREAAESAGRDPVGVFVARDAAGRVRGAAMVQVIPGALGVAWPPVAESAGESDELVHAACDWLRERGVKVCQAFAAPAEVAAMAPLERHGFRHITQLISMRCDTRVEVQASSLVFEPVAQPLTEAFREVLLSTHSGSLDCPELDGIRTPDELVDGYDSSLAIRCYLALQDKSPAGVVLLGTGPTPEVIELAYMAIVPPARGRGFGNELIRFALAEAARLEAASLTLCVDARNDPALALYRRNGFVETERREVFLAHFSEP